MCATINPKTDVENHGKKDNSIKKYPIGRKSRIPNSLNVNLADSKLWANIRKIKNMLKWQPTVNFEEGVKEMLKQINNWKNAPLWNPASIKSVTKIWFKYLAK